MEKFVGKYDEQLEKTFAAVTAHVESKWPIAKQSGRVTVSCTSSSYGIKIYKAEGEFDVSPKTTLEYIIPGPTRIRKHWDKTVKEWNVIETVSESSIVLQSVTKSAAWGLISSRDFVDLIRWGSNEESGLHYTCALGVDHPDCPETANFVRGWNHPCGMFCYPIDNGQRTKAIYTLHTELRGFLPVALVESQMASMLIETFTNLQAAIDAKLHIAS